MSQKSFDKGSLGQRAVEREFAGHNVLYWTDEKSSHPFDGIALEWETYDIVAIEVKTKAARTYYKDTGFNVSQYERLKKAREKFGKDPFVVFVDEGGKLIYGNFLSILERPRCYTVDNMSVALNLKNTYPSIERGIIYFPLKAMKKIAALSAPEVEDLRNLSERNNSYDYPPDEWYDDLDEDAK